MRRTTRIETADVFVLHKRIYNLFECEEKLFRSIWFGVQNGQLPFIHREIGAGTAVRQHTLLIVAQSRLCALSHQDLLRS